MVSSLMWIDGYFGGLTGEVKSRNLNCILCLAFSAFTSSVKLS